MSAVSMTAQRHWADAYIGAPFLNGGRTRAGCDCWGLVRLVYAEQLALELPSYGEISAHDLARVAGAITLDAADPDVWRPVERAAARAFDVCVMRQHGARLVGHVGVLLDAATVLHVEEKTQAVAVPLAHYSVRQRIVGFHRFVRAS